MYLIYISNTLVNEIYIKYMNYYFRIRCCQSTPAEWIHGDHHRPHVRYFRWTIQTIQVEAGRSALCRVYMLKYVCIHTQFMYSIYSGKEFGHWTIFVVYFFMYKNVHTYNYILTNFFLIRESGCTTLLLKPLRLQLVKKALTKLNIEYVEKDVPVKKIA